MVTFISFVFIPRTCDFFVCFFMSDIYLSPLVATKTYGVSRPTLVRWGRLGKIRFIRCGTESHAPHRYHKYDLERFFGTRHGADEEKEAQQQRKVILYARVSSTKQKEAGDLDR